VLRGEVAVVGVVGDLFDGFDDGFGLDAGFARQVRRGDLECIEKQTGAFRVQIAAGDAEHDLADGDLDGGAVFGEGKLEG